MKIYELLNLKPYELFKIKCVNSDSQEAFILEDPSFCFNKEDKLKFLSKHTGELYDYGDQTRIITLIHNPDLIVPCEKEYVENEKILNEHDSIVLSGIESRCNITIQSVKRTKDTLGFQGYSNKGDFYIGYLELDLLKDKIDVEFDIEKDERGAYVAKQKE